MATATSDQKPIVHGGRAVRSTIALKILMALSGLAFVGFTVAHMYGNLKAFGGADSFNSYAAHLRELGEPYLPYYGVVWILRIGLLVALIVHVGCAIVLARRSRKARPHGYAVKRNAGSALSSRTMRWGGVTLLVFIIWHLINFTFGKVNITGGETNNPYNLLVDTFGVWWMTLIYLVAMLALGFHLHHGTWSSMQTLGLTNTPRSRSLAKSAGWVVALVIAGGFSLVPLGVLFGIITK